MDDRSTILRFLEDANIPYTLHTHPPVQDIGDCAAIAEPFGALYPKNLFLTTRSKGNHFLLLLRPFLRYNASEVSKQAQSTRLQFGGDAALYSLLRAQPGCITPLSLFLPCAKDVQLLIDAELLHAEKLCFHPLAKDATVLLNATDFFQSFLPLTGHTPRFLSL